MADHEFNWVTSAEPHATRRKAILAKYGPQVRALYGYDNWTAVQVRLCSFENAAEPVTRCCGVGSSYCKTPQEA